MKKVAFYYFHICACVEWFKRRNSRKQSNFKLKKEQRYFILVQVVGKMGDWPLLISGISLFSRLVRDWKR